MTEKLNKFIEDKWENYSLGLSLGVSLRKDKEYRYDDVKDSFSAGINEFLQVLYHNNIDVDKLDFDVEGYGRQGKNNRVGKKGDR